MLNIILKRSGVVTGPRKKHCSHSSLGVIKKDLLGQPQFHGGEYFLLEGSAVHEPFLVGDYTNAYKRVDKDYKLCADGMVKKLKAHPVVCVLMKDAICEHKFAVIMNGVKVVVILDAKQLKLKRGFDLKTTTCRTQKEFEEKMRSLDYIRQGLTYKLAARLEKFYFVGVNKQKPHHIFIVDIQAKQFAYDYKYAEAELKFLLYFYKHYGKTISRKSAHAND